MEVIVYTNDNGGVSVTIPSGELPIETVLAKDCPQNAIIVDNAIFPQNADAKFFNAWELNGSTISVNFDKAKTIANKNLDDVLYKETEHRINKIKIGLTNTLNDSDWLQLINNCRIEISSSTTTQELVDILNLIEDTIKNNQ